ncbi:hypothetical protein F4212_15085, partial [Candidatus Poribacteria bacterium]|nr:hypothetical protein [Candidatus Poribacteria bacterium]
MDENADGGTVTSVATENATSVTVDDDRFEVADGNLKLKAGTMLDFESDTSPIDVTITASGDGAGATHTVSVSINDVNEAPSISVADGTTPDGVAAASTIDENAAGVPVGEIMLSDPDAGDTHTLSVDDDRFETSQDAEGGWWLKLKDGMSLDHEEAGSVMVTVTVTDAGGLSASTDVTVTVNNVDEAPSAPQVRGDLFDVDENAGGVAITSLSDSTDPEGDAVTYAVDDDRFEITAGLVLRVKDDAVLDHEAGGSVDIMLTAMDPAGNVSDATVVTITINDVNEAPSVSVADGAVDENDAGASVGAVTGTDEDGDTLAYTVSGGGDRFEVVGGMLKLQDGMSLNHETADSVTVTVTATDPDGLSASTDVVTVTVNDVNESFMLEVADGAVDENAAGATVGSVAVSGDPDDGDTHTFAVSGGGDRFEVADGMLKLKDDAMLNHEAEESVTVTVTATDSGGNSVSEDVMVTVNDVNEDPSFAQSSYAFNLSENEDGSTTAVSLGMVSATDEDAADTHTFSITGGNGDGLFAIDSATGEISYVGTGEDYRSSVTGPSHTLTVEVSDGTSSDEATVAITILNANDAPEFGASSYAFDLAENADGSTTAVDVGMVSASDSDEGDSVTYSITAGNDDGLFAIDSASGAITYVGSGEDAETTASHALTVSASDGSAMSEAMVTVNVTNANDSAPMFGEDSYAFDLVENADGSATAVAVGMVSATDSDGDTLEYSISGGNDDGLFAIDSASGAITYVGMGENYESDTKSHELMVEASDGSDSASATVAVSVTDVNDAPSADAEMMVDTLALVSGEAGSMEVDLAALFSDEDGDSLTFSLADAPDWLSLSVTRSGDAVTGSIDGTPPADGDDMDPAMVKIVATDPDGATGEASFYLVVDAANAAPSSVTLKETKNGVTSVVTAVTVGENTMGAGFGMLEVEDVDHEMHPHGQHTFTFMINGAATDKFEVADGMLKLKDDMYLNHEDYTNGTFTLTVTATDGGEVSSRPLEIDVTVTDAADGPVAGKIGDWWVVVDDRLDAEDAGEGEWLSFGLDTSGDDAAFTDPDGSKLSYSISVTDDSDGSAVDWLQINANTGAMTNVEGKVPDAGVYTVMVTASDGDSSTEDASASFKLAVA